MKKWIIFLFILGAIAAGIYWAYTVYVPRKVADALVSEDGMAALPEKIQEQAKALKTEVEKQVAKVPELMEEADLEYKDLVNIIDEVDTDQVLDAFEELKLRDWKTTDDVFDIGLKHVSIPDYDLERFRSAFNDAVTTARVEEVLDAMEESKLLTSMSIPMIKETAKRLMETKKEEIEQKLNL